MTKMTLPKVVNTFHLKWIALGSMLADHVNMFLITDLLTRAEQAETFSMKVQTFLRGCSDLLWFLGRIAFPMYAFLLVQGFLHTRSRLKYAGRLFLFALLSEIPFDMATLQCVLEFRTNNVFWTLLTGLLLLWGISLVEDWCAGRRGGKWLQVLGTVLLTVAALAVMNVLSSDYNFSGVLVILALYLLRRHTLLSFGTAVLILMVVNFAPVMVFAALGLIPLAMYNGERGAHSMKTFFYVFYPAHLLVLVGIGVLLGTYSIYL